VPSGRDVEPGGETTAPYDTLLATRLGAPATPRSIYLEEASIYRPMSTGDIFRGVPVPGSLEAETRHDLTMVVAHPSAMRRGAKLEPRARAAPVIPITGLSRTKWARGHFNVFPLPQLHFVASENGFGVEERAWGAQLELSAPIDTTRLDVTQRVACLSPEGVHLLLQRLVHADTRASIRLDTLAGVFAPKLEEIELLETWQEELAAPAIASGGQVADTLARTAEEFDAFAAGAKSQSGESLRVLLDDSTRASEARRIVAAEIRRRRAVMT
jgi:hypothetical protein